MPCVQTFSSLRHPEDNMEATLRPEDASIPVALMLLVILELPRLEISAPHQTEGNRPSLVSTIRRLRKHITPYYTYIYAVQSSPTCIMCQRPPIWHLWTEADFSACNLNNQALTITDVTIDQHVQFVQLRRSRSYHPPLCTQIQQSLNRPSSPMRIGLFSKSKKMPITELGTTVNPCISCNYKL